MHDSIVQRVISLLESPTVGVSPIPHVQDKTEFGDVDFLVHTSVPMTELIDTLQGGSTPLTYTINGNTISVAFPLVETPGYAQVDLMCVRDKDEYEYQRLFYAHGDLNAIFGVLARHYGLKYAVDGLYARIHTDKEVVCVLLTRNHSEALNILGYQNLPSSFASEQAVFDYAISGELAHNSIWANTDSLSADRRRCLKKRKMYRRFVEWTKQVTDPSEQRYWGHDNGERRRQRLLLHGFDLNHIRDRILLEQAHQAQSKQVLAGKYLMQACGIGPGPIVGELKSYIRGLYSTADLMQVANTMGIGSPRHIEWIRQHCPM